MITIQVQGEPFGKRRPRAHVIAGHARVHDDPANQLYELKVQNALRQAYPDHDPNTPFFQKDECVKIRIYAMFGIPKAFSKKKVQEAINGEIRPTKRPDADNIAKACMDALSHGIAFHDDAQVVELNIYKYYSTNPQALIQIKSTKDHPEQ